MVKKKSPYTQMERVRAARAVLVTPAPNNERAELMAFMDIFHPEIQGKRLAKIMAAWRN